MRNDSNSNMPNCQLTKVFHNLSTEKGWLIRGYSVEIHRNERVFPIAAHKSNLSK